MRLRFPASSTITFAWTGTVFGLSLLLVLDFWLVEPFRKIDVPTMAIGCLAMLNAASNECAGRYNAKIKVIYRDREPTKFVTQTKMLLSIGALMILIGSSFQLLGWYDVTLSR